MKIKTNRIITLGLALLFVLSFLLPALRGPLGINLSGFSVFIANIATVIFVESFADYCLFLFTALTNVWVVLLLIWSLRNKVKIFPTIILSLWVITSAFSWFLNMEGDNILLIGFWLWIISSLLIVIFTIHRSLTVRSN